MILSHPIAKLKPPRTPTMSVLLLAFVLRLSFLPAFLQPFIVLSKLRKEVNNDHYSN
nr:MAG TPA: hypothetical protein [Caudoviricetes sp.]